MKVIYVSNIYGNFAQVVSQISRISSKNGKFDLIILNGIVFNEKSGISGISDLLTLDTKVVILDVSSVGILMKHIQVDEVNCLIKGSEGYFSDYLNNKYIFGEEYIRLNETIYILKRSGVVNIDGLRIAFLNGYESKEFSYLENLDEKTSKERYNFSRKYYTSSYFTKPDVERLFEESNIDILLLNSLPEIIYNELQIDSFMNSPFKREDIKIKVDELKSKSSIAINSIINSILPRYILISTGEDFYYERVPFFNDDRISRILHIGCYPSTLKVNQKEKSMYAINIEPLTEGNLKLVEESEKKSYTENPFSLCSKNLLQMYLRKINLNSNIISENNPFKQANLINTISYDEVYVGNIAVQATKDEIKNLLQSKLNISIINIAFPNKEQKNTGFAFVKVLNLDETKLQTILSSSNKLSLHGRKLILGEKIEKKIVGDNNKDSTVLNNLSCWFCFENPKIDLSLILKDFNHFYIAFPKGAIDEYHFLIVPKKHIFSTNHLSKNQAEELDHIINKIFEYLKIKGLDFFVYEKYLPFKDDVFKHSIINIVGVAQEKSFNLLDFSQNFFLKKCKTNPNLKFNYYSLEKYYSDSIKCKNEYFFSCIFPDGVGGTLRIVIDVNEINTNNIDIMRQMICTYIEKEENFDWKRSTVVPKDLNLMKTEINKLFNL